MALEFLDAAYKVRLSELRGAALTILRYLCKEIPQHQQYTYLKTRQGHVDRRFIVIMFYNRCSRKTVTNAIKTLTDLKLLKAVKKGANECYRFYIHLDNLQKFRMTYKMWEAAQVDLGPRVSRKEMVAEEENEWEEESLQEEAMNSDEGKPIPVADEDE